MDSGNGPSIAKATGDGRPHYVLRLFVTGATARSRRAIANLTTICAEHLDGQYELEVIDIYQQPLAAQTNQIVAAPTLIRTLPAPIRKLVGDLSDTEKVLVGLDLQPRESEP